MCIRIILNQLLTRMQSLYQIWIGDKRSAERSQIYASLTNSLLCGQQCAGSIHEVAEPEVHHVLI